jgi:integrase
MATIRKHRSKWQAQIRLKGIKPIAKSFAKKSEAVAWSKVTESRVILGSYVDPRTAESTLVSDIINRYINQLKGRNKLDPSLKSRCKRLTLSLGAFSLAKLSVTHLSEYRDQRLEVANPATVCHELSLLRRILRLANTEWGITIPNGIPQVRLPKMPRGRTRRLQAGEEEELLSLCVNDPTLRDFILLALETAMRRSELIAMKWSDIDFKGSTLSIPVTKTGVPRVIPLSRKTLSILEVMERVEERVFDITATRVSQRFARVCGKAGIDNLRLHDLRHEGISKLFELGLNQMEVAAISGHETVSMLSRYTHIDPQWLVARMKLIQQGKRGVDLQRNA